MVFFPPIDNMFENHRTKSTVNILYRSHEHTTSHAQNSIMGYKKELSEICGRLVLDYSNLSKYSKKVFGINENTQYIYYTYMNWHRRDNL